MPSVLLSAKDLKLAFGNQVLLDGVSLAVAPGEKVGLVGRNGCGKTSLFKILAGESGADSGDISRRRGLRVGYLPQEFELDGAKTVLENIEAGAADLVEAIRRYEAGEGHDNDLSDLLELIQHADGWNLQTRIRAEAGSLAAPRSTPWSDRSRAEKSAASRSAGRWPRSRISSSSTSRRTPSTSPAVTKGGKSWQREFERPHSRLCQISQKKA